MKHQVVGGTRFSNPMLFWAGTAAIVAGVLAHVPMFLHSAPLGYRMVGMPVDGLMIFGMSAIVAGILGAFFSTLPRRQTSSRETLSLQMHQIDDAKLTYEHWKVIATLVAAVVIDVMKPATLSFVVPGMRSEYGMERDAVALFPLVALIGTTIGSILWGFMADVIGRRATILLSALMFIGTSICGTMPAFEWNLVMCFMMGMSAGGLLPITFALMAEIAPARHRGWLLVLIGSVGTAGGYLAASGNAALLEPVFGWRALWFAGVPTGLMVIVLNRFIPESPRFLCLHGRVREARIVLARFGVTLLESTHIQRPEPASVQHGLSLLFRGRYGFLTLGLALCGIAWGLVNFGFMLWLPDTLRTSGISAEMANSIVAKSAFFALPAVLLVTWMYYSWSTRHTLLVFTLLIAISLLGFFIVGGKPIEPWVLISLLVLLLVSTTAVISVLLPYSAEVYPVWVRASGVGLIAGSSKFGGVLGACIGFASFIAGFGHLAVIAVIPIALSSVILAWTAIETRARRLEDMVLEPSHLEARRPL